MFNLALAIIAIATVFGGNRLIHGRATGLNPWAATMGLWAVDIGLYLVNPLKLDRVSASTWTVISLTLAAFTVGYGIPIAARRSFGTLPTALGIETPKGREARDLRWVWRGAIIWWLVLLAVYLRYLTGKYGLSPERLLTSLRADLGAAQSAPVGFYYFYAAALLVPLAAFLYIHSSSPLRRRTYALVGFGALASLPLTSGRGNLISAVGWVGSTWYLARGPRSFDRRVVMWASAGLVAVVFAFVVLGNLTGKTFGNNELSRALPDSHFPKPLMIPYLYAVGAFPTLDQILAGQPAIDSRIINDHLVTLRPAFQIASLVDEDIAIPQKIQGFRRIPYKFNYATFIAPIYKDWGLPGVYLFAFLLGLGSAWVYLAWLRTPRISTALLVTLVIAVGVGIGDLRANDLSTCLHAVLLWALVLRLRTTGNAAESGTRTTRAGAYQTAYGSDR